MTDKNRNFRSSYYDKVGFRGVEEKKSLEKIINEKPMVREKLSKFCMNFTLPSIYRELVWKVLLDIISVNTETHDYIMNKRIQHYQFMKESLEVMKKIDENTPKSVIHTLMYLMTEDVLLFDQQEQLPKNIQSCRIQKYLNSSKTDTNYIEYWSQLQNLPELDNLEGKNLIAISSVFLKLCTCEVTSYWLFKNFIIHQKKFNINQKILNDQLEMILKKEDNELYEHLKQIQALEILPVSSWFGRYFADVLHHNALARVFDKIIGGSYKILPYIGSAILMIIKRPLLDLNSADKIMQVLEKIPEDTSDVIVNKAFDLYLS